MLGSGVPNSPFGVPLKRAGLFVVVSAVAALVPAPVPTASPDTRPGINPRTSPHTSPGTAHAADACRVPRVPLTRPRPGAPGARDRSELTPAQVTQVERQFSRLLALKGSAAGARAATINVPVYVHVLYSGATGNLSDSAIKAQIAVLNTTYGGRTGGTSTGFTFTLQGVTRTDNAAWYTRTEQNENAIKTKLHKGGKGTLNLYTAGLDAQVLGWSTFPWEYAAHPAMDGVVVHAGSIPGGTIAGFNKGYTATHETGHWLGLYHTFQNGCAKPGDTVDDTPFERDPSDGCPTTRDTCPAAGTDPVHNFMDYSQDDCMTQFSTGQGDRMRKIWATYRS
jgi:pregnancy-associated plasma protein-A